MLCWPRHPVCHEWRHAASTFKENSTAQLLDNVRVNLSTFSLFLMWSNWSGSTYIRSNSVQATDYFIFVDSDEIIKFHTKYLRPHTSLVPIKVNREITRLPHSNRITVTNKSPRKAIINTHSVRTVGSRRLTLRYGLYSFWYIFGWQIGTGISQKLRRQSRNIIDFLILFAVFVT